MPVNEDIDVLVRTYLRKRMYPPPTSHRPKFDPVFLYKQHDCMYHFTVHVFGQTKYIIGRFYV